MTKNMSDDMPRRVLARFKEAMAVVIRNVANHDWGWFSREDPRMHLQTVEEGARVGPKKAKVWLENKGKRTFEMATNNVAGAAVRKLRTTVQANRKRIEDEWIVFMISSGWLKAQLNGRIVTLTAYSGTHNSFTREVDLGREFPGAYQESEYSWDKATVYVDLDPEHCALAVGIRKDKDSRNHIHLVDVLFVD